MHYSWLIAIHPGEVDTIFINSLEIENLGRQKFQQYGHGHTAYKWQSQDVNPGISLSIGNNDNRSDCATHLGLISLPHLLLYCLPLKGIWLCLFLTALKMLKTPIICDIFETSLV